MQAIILAAGMGKRLGKYTRNCTKCMVSVGGKRLIDRAVEALRLVGIGRLVIVDGYQADNLEKYLPANVTEIVSGGAKGIDRCASDYAKEHDLKLTEFLPEYERYGRGAPLKRNLRIIEYEDLVIAFWDGKSRGTKFVIEQCRRQNKKVTVVDL